MIKKNTLMLDIVACEYNQYIGVKNKILPNS